MKYEVRLLQQKANDQEISFAVSKPRQLCRSEEDAECSKVSARVAIADEDYLRHERF